MDKSLTFRICDWLTKYSIFALVALVPIFFLPWTSDVLDFNKQTIIVLLSFIAVFAWMLKVLISGKFEMNISKVHIIVGVLFLIYLLATIFSVYAYGSFWGSWQIVAESLLSIISISLVYFLVSNAVSEKNIATSIHILSISILITQIVGVLQLLGAFILPFDFAKSITFNLVGSVGALGFVSVIILPIAICLLISSKKWWKILFILQIILSFLVLFLINYAMVWWVVILGSAFLMVIAMLKRNAIDGRWMGLPMFFLAVALFFVLLNPQLNITQRTTEVYLSQNATLKIAMQSIKERPIFGSGPGTFSYDFSKFKEADFNKSSLWNFVFNRGSSQFLDALATTGILGFLALLALAIYPVFLGVQYLIREKIVRGESTAQKEHLRSNWILVLGLSTALFVQAVVFIFYNANITLSFTFLFTIACLIALISEGKTHYELKPSSILTLIVTFAFTLIFIFGLGLLILDGQRYIAEVNYYHGLSLLQAQKISDAQNSLESAASLNPSSDLYFRQLSQLYLLNLTSQLQNIKGTPTDAQKNQIQTLIANSVNAGKIATDLSSKNSINWSSRGYVYQNLYALGLLTDGNTWALSSYDQALTLDPSDPYLYLQEGNVNYISAQKLGQTNPDQKIKLLTAAQAKLEKAVALNPNYSSAMYSLGLTYDALGQKDKAIAEFTTLQKLNPQDTSIPKILANLNAGLPALQSGTPPPTTPPSENSPGSTTVKNPPAKSTTK